jgi:hypothetical protein
MMTRSTRLEFMIVTIAFVVLLLCSRPPKPGNAETEDLASPTPQTTWTMLEPAASSPTSPVAETTEPPEPNIVEEAPIEPNEILLSDTSAAPKPQTKRMAVVDARACEGLGYNELMYGEVTVRWIWDGNRFVPRKVCVVKEPNGSTSVWSFDQPGKAVIKEIGEAPLDTP